MKKKLEEAQKAVDKAEQDGYEVGEVETKEALKAKVMEVCRHYCLYVWNEAFNQAGVEASSTLRKAESIYYPPAIRASNPLGSKANTASKEADVGKSSPANAPLSSNNLSKEAWQPGTAEKKADITKGVALDATQPPAIPKDPSKEKEAPHNMEIVLATLPMRTKEDSKGKSPTSSITAPAQSTKPLVKDKLVLKLK